jgi:CelD/BcsL family acetyltransferase involved in cellulose biosynthesis
VATAADEDPDPRRTSFFRRYAAAASRAGQLRIGSLRIGGELAAMLMAVQTNHGFWLLGGDYDARFGRCSPGTLLLRESIAAAAAAGLDTFEFLGAVQPWTQNWTRTAHEQVSLHVYPRRAARLAAFTASAAGKLLNAWRRS